MGAASNMFNACNAPLRRRTRYPIYVFATKRDSVAHRILCAEFLPHLTLVCDGQTGYAEQVAYAWRRGEGFIAVEDDVCPWPGAMEQIDGCDVPWCGFNYPIGGGPRAMAASLGCWKVTAELTREHPDLWRSWVGESWGVLDDRIVRVLSETTGQDGFHVHAPPLAHARHFRL